MQLGNLDVARDFTDVRDLVFAYQKLLEHPDAKGVYNVCSGQAATLEQVIAMCEQNAGYKIEVSVNPEFVRQNEIKVLYGSEQRLRSILGEYRRYTLPQTIQWMFEA